MHELAVCRSLLRQVERVAMQHGADEVASIHLSIGPLSGIEVPLLEQAFSIARAGTVAEGAELVTSLKGVRVRCGRCDKESAVTVNRLVCLHCGDWRTQLVSGDEMELTRVEINIPETVN